MSTSLWAGLSSATHSKMGLRPKTRLAQAFSDNAKGGLSHWAFPMSMLVNAAFWWAGGWHDWLPYEFCCVWHFCNPCERNVKISVQKYHAHNKTLGICAVQSLLPVQCTQVQYFPQNNCYPCERDVKISVQNAIHTAKFLAYVQCKAYYLYNVCTPVQYFPQNNLMIN